MLGSKLIRVSKRDWWLTDWDWNKVSCSSNLRLHLMVLCRYYYKSIPLNPYHSVIPHHISDDIWRNSLGPLLLKQISCNIEFSSFINETTSKYRVWLFIYTLISAMVQLSPTLNLVPGCVDTRKNVSHRSKSNHNRPNVLANKRTFYICYTFASVLHSIFSKCKM